MIVNRPPKGILDGVVRNLEHSIRSCALSDLISIVTDEPIFTLLWHRAAHLLGLHINGKMLRQNRLQLFFLDGQENVQWVLFSPSGLCDLISLSMAIFSREPYCCIQYLADSESVLILTIAKV
mgnify:CR=1 FL=1